MTEIGLVDEKTWRRSRKGYDLHGDPVSIEITVHPFEDWVSYNVRSSNEDDGDVSALSGGMSRRFYATLAELCDSVLQDYQETKLSWLLAEQADAP